MKVDALLRTYGKMRNVVILSLPGLKGSKGREYATPYCCRVYGDDPLGNRRWMAAPANWYAIRTGRPWRDYPCVAGTVEDYADLLAELAAMGYEVNVVDRETDLHKQARLEAVKALELAGSPALDK